MVYSIAILAVIGYAIMTTFMMLKRGEELAKTQQQLDLLIKSIEVHKNQWLSAQNGYERRLEAYADEVVTLKKYILGNSDGRDIDFTRILQKKGYPSRD